MPELHEPSAEGIGEGAGFWVSVGDMMSGLMIVFLFIALSYMVEVVKERDKVKEVAVLWNDTQGQLYDSLEVEFRGDLARWKADLDRQTLAVRFREPEVLFEAGSARVTERFGAILADFFPRYLRRIRQFDQIVEEIRLEGHTSSEGPRDGHMDPYFYNMELSQSRTREVLRYCLALPGLAEAEKNWARRYITANGLSYSRLVLDSLGREDQVQSRRVEFRVRTNAEQRLVQILEAGAQ